MYSLFACAWAGISFYNHIFLLYELSLTPSLYPSSKNYTLFYLSKTETYPTRKRGENPAPWHHFDLSKTERFLLIKIQTHSYTQTNTNAHEYIDLYTRSAHDVMYMYNVTEYFLFPFFFFFCISQFIVMIFVHGKRMSYFM